MTSALAAARLAPYPDPDRSYSATKEEQWPT